MATAKKKAGRSQVISPREYLSEGQVPETRKKRIIEREISRIYERDGTVSAQALVDEGRDESSPLHGFFEWRDEVAAEKYRLTQAYQMIQATKFVTFLTQSRNTRRQPRVTQRDTVRVRALLPGLNRGEFKMRNEVLSETDMRQKLVQRKLGVLQTWCNSVVDIKELNRIRTLIERELNQAV